MFELNLIEFEEITVQATTEGRKYTTPEGNVYPSVTNVLSKTKDMTGLMEWRKAVGDEAANREMNRAASRGNGLHLLCERFIQNEEIDLRHELPVPVQLFTQLRPILKRFVNNIRGIESPLYSDFLKVAGRVDLIADFDGVRAIVDYKSSNNPKQKDWIEDYFIQTSMYSVMFEERTKLPVPRLAILIANETGGKPSVFVEKRDNFINKAIDRIHEYSRL